MFRIYKRLRRWGLSRIIADGVFIANSDFSLVYEYFDYYFSSKTIVLNSPISRLRAHEEKKQRGKTKSNK